MKHILVVTPFLEKHRKQLAQAAPGCEFIYCQPWEVTAERLTETDILIGNVKPAQIGAPERLKWVQLASSGADAYVKPGVLRPGTKLTCSTGAYSKAVAEHAFAMTLMLQKKLHLYRDNQSRAAWRDMGDVTSIADSAVAVIGLGEIGTHYARMAKALGAYVIGVRRRPGPGPESVDEVYTMEALDEILSRADVVMSVLPETELTHHLYTKERFERMKPTAVFINVGRGGAVASETLCEALSDGQIAAAGVDVTELEPLPGDSPLWTLPNLMITPHISGDFHLPETLDRVADIAAENLAAYLKGEELRNQVDFETGYRKGGSR